MVSLVVIVWNNTKEKGKKTQGKQIGGFRKVSQVLMKGIEGDRKDFERNKKREGEREKGEKKGMRKGNKTKPERKE